MTHAERKRLAKYLRTAANTLGLMDWTLEVMPDEPDTKEAYASVSCAYGRKIAAIWFQDGFEALEPETQRHVIVHELTHIHFDGMLSLAETTLPAVMGAPAFGVFEAALRERLEHGVDAVANAFAGALPLPEIMA